MKGNKKNPQKYIFGSKGISSNIFLSHPVGDKVLSMQTIQAIRIATKEEELYRTL